jgi:hypothetical protein
MIRSAFAALFVLLLAVPPSFADEKDEWLEFFAGDWTREEKTWTEKDGWREDVASWSCERVAGGAATVSKGKWKQSGYEWVLLSSYDADRFHFENGVSSLGMTWSIDFEKVDTNTLRGKATGNLDGQDWKADVVLKKTGDDSYVASGEAKTQDGKVVLKVEAKNTRSRRSDVQKYVQAWQKFLAGEWTYEISPDGVKGEVKWALAANGNAMIGRFEDSDGSNAIEISGWQPDRQVETVHGFSSNGGYWVIELKGHTTDSIEGKNYGRLSDGRTFNGTFVANREGENQYRWDFKGTTGDGKELEMMGKYTRKR